MIFGGFVEVFQKPSQCQECQQPLPNDYNDDDDYNNTMLSITTIRKTTTTMTTTTTAMMGMILLLLLMMMFQLYTELPSGNLSPGSEICGCQEGGELKCTMLEEVVMIKSDD